MKTSAHCPKCGSDQVVMLINQSFGTKIYPRDSYANISSVERFVCSDCGYLETYLVDQEELAELKKSIK